VSAYLSKLSSLLHWDIVAQQLSIKHENEAVGQTALRSLARVVDATNDDVRVQSRGLTQQIIEKIIVDLKKYTIAFTRCHNDLPSVSFVRNPREIDCRLLHVAHTWQPKARAVYR